MVLFSYSQLNIQLAACTMEVRLFRERDVTLHPFCFGGKGERGVSLYDSLASHKYSIEYKIIVRNILWQ